MSVDFTTTVTPAEPGPEDVRAVLLEAFGIDGDLNRLDGEHDLNWRVDSEQGRWVAKVSRESEEPDLHRCQDMLMMHIQRVDPGIRIPIPAATKSGDSAATIMVGDDRWRVRVYSFIPGIALRHVDKTPQVLEALGEFMGRLCVAMQGFGHPAAHHDDFLWNLDNAEASIGMLGYIEPDETRSLAGRAFDRWKKHVKPVLHTLPAAVVHQDANDDNVLVETDHETVRIGLVDFGDAVFARRVNELAVVLAYALMDVADVIDAARSVIRGYTNVFPLQPGELSVVFDLAAARLAMSLCISHQRRVDRPDNAYLQVSQQQAVALLQKLDAMNSHFAACLARSAGGHAAVGSHDAVVTWLSARRGRFESVFPFDLNTAPRIVITLDRNSPGIEYADNAAAYGRWLEERINDAGARYAIGLYGERRDCYTSDQFRSEAGGPGRSVHLGIDLFVPAGTPVHAPLPGRVLSAQDNDLPLDYGPTVILEHQCGPGGPRFWTLYGHLARDGLARVTAGEQVKAGQVLGGIGTPGENGGWAPHLHFQVITDMLGETGNFHGAGEPGNLDVWSRICPDPNLVLGLAPETFASRRGTPEALRTRREQLLGPSLSLSYTRKLQIARGRGAWLYDHTGRAYLDCVNNICHVGHSHPHVVEALSAQAAILNTNTRYLHPNIVAYAERLLATFPDPLSVCFFVCSGSEANELALRLARNYTRRHDLLVLDWAYHGNTGGLIDISPYKFNRKGGRGKPDHVDIAELPDPYRGPHKGYDASTGVAYCRYVDEGIENCRSRTGCGPAAMIAESMPGCGGQIVFPDRYLAHAFARVRDAGGICIADEVQTGFGRVGSAMWAFELQETVPDIVTLGKPMGNGHPMAAVVTTRQIADAFANGMEYFNSFGGNPVSCAVGMAVMDVIEDEGLQEKARITGRHLLDRLHELVARHRIIGDVRGRGMFIGIELVKDRTSLEPATDIADRVINRMREDGVLLSTDGPHDNVLKLKPPLAFGAVEADLLCGKLDRALRDLERTSPPQG